MEHVKFKNSGKWADAPRDPIIEVSAGEVVEVSSHLAKIVVDSGNGERVSDPLISVETKDPETKDPETKDPETEKKSPKNKKPSAADKEAAESK